MALITMAPSIKDPISTMSTPLLASAKTSTHSSSSSTSSEGDDNSIPPSPSYSFHFQHGDATKHEFRSFKQLAVLPGHVGSVSCLALCGEFILSASQGKDIIVWQQPDLRRFTKFGHGDNGSVKALVTVGNKVFTAHQDGRIRVWKVSRRSENVFRLVNTLPTAKDYLGKFMDQRNYVQTRRHHKRLWIEHADSISCLAVFNGLIYSGSWDKTLKVWRISDLKCLESIKAHDDAINNLVVSNGIAYSASADGKIKAWERNHSKSTHSLKAILESNKEVSINSVIVSGNRVYGGNSDGSIMSWEGDTEFLSWKLASETKAHAMAVLCMCLMGNDCLCSGSADKTIGIWKMDICGNLCKIGVINGHEGPVKCLQASTGNVGNGFLIYSGGFDKSLRVWWVPKSSAKEEQDTSMVLY